jgi:hypothetical protein
MDTQRAMQQQNLNTQEGKNIFRRIFDTAASGLRRLGHPQCVACQI